MGIIPIRASISPLTIAPVKRNSGDISAGLNLKPAGNSTGRLFGRGCRRAIPRLGIVQKNPQNEASEKGGTGGVVGGAHIRFSPDFREFADFSSAAFRPYLTTKPPRR